MEPLSKTIKFLNSKNITHRSRELSILLRGNQILNGTVKQENIDNQAFNQFNKEDIGETDHHSDSKLLEIGSRAVPLPPHMIHGDQELNENIKLEIVDDQVFNGMIKKEMTEETDSNNDGRLFQISSRAVPLPPHMIHGDQELNENIKLEIVDDQVFNGMIKKEMTEETDSNNDGRLFQISSRAVPLPPHLIHGDQELNENIKLEIVDDQVFNGMIKKEMTDETDRNNDGRLFQISSRAVPLPPHMIHGDQELNENIKLEIVDDQVFNGMIKKEMTEETDSNNDGRLFQISSRAVPLPPHMVHGDQELNENIKLEIVDDQVFNGMIKKEVTDETDRNNDGRLFQISSRVVPLPPHMIHGDQELNENIKLEIVDDQVFNGMIKKEMTEETDSNNDGRLFQISSRAVPLPPHMVHGDQELNENIKLEIVDDQVFNGMIKKEVTDETDRNNDGRLFQIRTKTKEKINSIDTEIRTEIEFIDDNVFEETVTSMNSNSNLTSNGLRENPLSNNCDKMSTVSNLTVYPRSYNQEKLYKCDICSQTFIWKSILTAHARTHTGEKPYRYEICDSRFSTSSSLTVHARTHTGEKQFKCKICDQAFSQNAQLIAHKKTHTGKKLYRCEICDSRFSTSSSLTVHARTHTGEKQFKCKICDRAFSQNAQLIAHKKTHTGEKLYRYEICDSRFSQNINLTRHLRTHTGERPFKCNICNSEFSDASNLTKHLRTHSGEKPYKCGICDQAFSRKAHVIIHLRTHSGEKPYKCNICHLKFSDASNLTVHARTHSGEKPYKCGICDQAFSRKAHVIIHLRTHSGEKPYKCNICHSKFSAASNLTVHLRIHSGEKPYKCGICDQAFSRNAHVIIHLRTHSGEKPYKCNICNSEFSDASNFTKHLRTHSGEKPYKCGICDQAFSRNAYLMKHLRTHTEKKP